MTDYGHQVTFGLSLYPSVDLLEETKQLAQAADAAGLKGARQACAAVGHLPEPPFASPAVPRRSYPRAG